MPIFRDSKAGGGFVTRRPLFASASRVIRVRLSIHDERAILAAEKRPAAACRAQCESLVRHLWRGQF